MNGRDLIFLLNEHDYLPADAARVNIAASIDGWLSINAEYNVPSPPPIITDDELNRLKSMEIICGKVVKLLADGQVDFDLVAQLKGLLNE